MEGQGHSQGGRTVSTQSLGPLFTSSLSSLRRLKPRKFWSRRRHSREEEPQRQVVTCAHTAYSWFERPACPGDETDDGRRTMAENARATLRELLADSVVVASDARGVLPTPLSEETQSAIHHQLLEAFDFSVQRHRGRASPLRIEPCFTLFPSLPAEIRLQTWRAALPRPGRRTLHIGQRPGLPCCWTVRLPPPALLWVCRESREVARGMTFELCAFTQPWMGIRPLRGFLPRYTASWATAADCLDCGDEFTPAAVYCADYEARARDFDAAAHAFARILYLPRISEVEQCTGNMSCSKGVRKLMVVVQVAHIALPAWPPGELSDRAMRLHRDELPSLAEDGIRVCTMGDLAGGILLEPSGYHDTVVRTLKNHHVTAVVSLRDRLRLEELLALGTVTGYWTDRDSRLRSLGYDSNAFCMDCLLEWWDRHAFGAAREALLTLGSGGASLDCVSATHGDPSRLPEIVPAIRFKIQWPGFEDDHPPGDVAR